MAASVEKTLEMLGAHAVPARPPSQTQQTNNAQNATLPSRSPSAPRLNSKEPRQPTNHHVPASNQNARPMGSTPEKPQQPLRYQQHQAQQQPQQHQRGEVNPLRGFVIPTSEMKKALGDNLSTAPSGEPIYTPDTHSKNGTGTSADSPSLSGGPVSLRQESSKDGYERKIGRGTSWRRDHTDRGEGQYTVRGRGRGSGGPPGRGRGGNYHHDSSRSSSGDYPPYRRDYDHRPRPPSTPPPLPAVRHPVEPRPYPPPDLYFESRGTYTASPPRYDTRREYPPDSGAARYYDDYRRGEYDSRGPPPTHPLPSTHSPSHSLPPSSHMDSRRLYDRDGFDGRLDPVDYGRAYPRSRDDYPPPPSIPRRVSDSRYPPDLDPRYQSEGRRRMDEARIIPLTPPPDVRRPPPEPVEYRGTRSSGDREYARVIPREVEQPLKSSDSANHTQKAEDIIEGPKHPKDLGDSTKGTTIATGPKSSTGAPGGPPLNNGAQPPQTTVASEPVHSLGRSDSKHQFDDYDRERGAHRGPPSLPPPPPPPAERYMRDDYGRAPPPPYYEGRRRGDTRENHHHHHHHHHRDYRGAYEGESYYDYPPPPPVPHSPVYGGGRETYPPAAAPGRPPLDYARGPPPRTTSYDERYTRGPLPMELDPPIRDGYRDYPTRSEYGTKRKYDNAEYMDAYYDDYRPRESRYAEGAADYPPRPAYDYDDREAKRFRAPAPDPRDSGFDRPPVPYDDRDPPSRDFPRPSYSHSSQHGPVPPPHPLRERTRPHGRYFLVKTSTADNIEKSRETVPSADEESILMEQGQWGIPVKDVEVFREAYKAGDVTLLFALDESGRFSGYAEVTSDIGSVQPMAWMEEHCTPVGAAFEVRHRTRDDVRTTTTAKARNFFKDGKPIRFGQDGQEISAKEAALVVDELERLSGPENAEKRAYALVSRGGPPRGRVRGRGGRGGIITGAHDRTPPHRGGYDRGRGRGRR